MVYLVALIPLAVAVVMGRDVWRKDVRPRQYAHADAIAAVLARTEGQA